MGKSGQSGCITDQKKSNEKVIYLTCLGGKFAIKKKKKDA